MSETPALSRAVEGPSPTTGNTSNHHRYGEVKTRLTIGRAGQFARYYHIVSRYYRWRSAMATTVTSKGQVTIPKPVRDYLGIAPGSQVEFRRSADGGIVIEKADGRRPPSRFAKAASDRRPGSCHRRNHGAHCAGTNRMTLVDSNVLLDIFTDGPRLVRSGRLHSWRTRLSRAASDQRRHLCRNIDPLFHGRRCRRDAPQIWISTLCRSRARRSSSRARPTCDTATRWRSHGVLPDFFIGAHAAVEQLPLLTRDARRYRTYFPTVELIAPGSKA